MMDLILEFWNKIFNIHWKKQLIYARIRAFILLIFKGKIWQQWLD